MKYDVYVENVAPKDQVVFQSEEMDQEVPLNTKIELKLSMGPPTTKQVTFNLMEEMVEPYSVIITRKDTKEEVYRATLENGESEVTLTLTGRDEVIYVITIVGIGEREEKVDFTTE